MYRVSINRVLETRVEVLGEREMLCEHEPSAEFPQLFRVLPNFHEYCYNLIETRRTCFLFLLEKNNLPTLINKMLVLSARSIIASTACASSLSLSSYIETRF